MVLNLWYLTMINDLGQVRKESTMFSTETTGITVLMLEIFF